MLTSRWDQTAFNKALREYCVLRPKVAVPDILNTKAYHIARKATYFTKKVSEMEIRKDMEASVATALVVTKSGRFSKNKKNKTFIFGGMFNPKTSRLAKIVIARMRQAGEHIPSGDDLQKLLVKEYNKRQMSRAFVASGWLAAIWRLAPLAIQKGGAVIAKEVRQPRAARLGKALPAFTAQSPKFIVKIFNNAFENKYHKSAIPIAEEGLGKAFDAETRDTMWKVKEWQARDAAKFNASQKK